MASLITLVVPVYNESAIIRASLVRILAAAAGEDYNLELIAVDDGSSDSTATEIEGGAADDPRIRPVIFTRNFGKEAAMLAGLEAARGDAVIVLDADLQHPPELIPHMVARWRQGFAVVEAVKSDRGSESIADGLSARAFYWLFRRFAEIDLAGHSDYKLLDRAVVDAYIAMPERNRFFRGLINWAGYPSARLPFEVPPRQGGERRWSKAKLLHYAINNLTSFSSLPLRIVTWVGVLTLSIGAVISANSLIQKLTGQALDGFTTVNLLLTLIGGAILVSLGIIGHYISRLYDEIKGRPSYLVKPARKNRP